MIRLLISGIIVFSLAGSLAGCNDPTSTVEGRGANTNHWWDKLPRAEWSAYPRLLEEHEWFEVHQVFPQVYAIYEPGQFEEVISFLIVGSQRALLFDTGLGIAAMQPVIAQLTDHEVLVLNSHSHYDHIGGNHEFSNIAGLDDARTQQRADHGVPTDEVIEFVSGDWLWKDPPADFTPADYRVRPYTITQTIADGMVIDLGDRHLEVLHTPGHSTDSICLLDRQQRLLFTGDTFYLAPLYAHLEGSNIDDYIESAARLGALQTDVDYLLTAHNVPVVAGSYLGRLNAAFAAIQSGRVTFTETDGAYEYDFDGFSIITPPR